MKRGLLKTVGLMGLMIAGNIINTFGQVNNYLYTTGTGAVLETGVFTSLLSSSQDDAASVVTNIGFTFNFGGTNYTQFSASSNGLVRLGATTVTTAYSNDLVSLGTAPHITAWWDDLYTASNGNVQYLLMGTAPNQKLVIEWNVTNCCPGTPFDKTFQVWLYETTNEVRFVYGTTATANSSTVAIATSGSDFQSVTTSSNTVSILTPNNSNATLPVSGRFYSFLPPPFDVQAQALTTPLATGCYTNAEAVAMTIRNNGSNPLDFSVNNTTVTVNVTGAVVTSFSTTLVNNSLNGGLPLASGATLNVPLGTLDMTTLGTYTFNGSVAAGDPNAANDVMPSVNRIVSGGTITVSANNICNGDTATLSLSGNTQGSIQWQDSIPGGSWNNIVGATTNPYDFAPSDTAYYRAVVCGNLYSTTDFINVILVGDPTTNDTSRCGAGPITLIANGTGTMHWYNMPSGGTLVHIGDTLTTNVSSDTTFYVSASTSTGGSTLMTMPAQTTTFVGNVRGMWFTAPTGFTITALEAPAGAGNQSITVVRFNPAVAPPFFPTTTNAFDILYLTQNDPTVGPISVNIAINSGDIIGIMSQRGTTTSYAPAPAASDIAGMPITLNRLGMQLPLTTNPPQTLWTEAGGNIGRTNITYMVGCESFRIPANVTVVPATPISLTATATSICDVDTITLTTTSTNTSYSYEYSPSTYLQDTTGASVDGWPQNDITYVVSALDTAGCTITDTVSIVVAHAPTGTLTMSDDFTCFGDSVTLNVTASAGGMFFSSGPPAPISETIPGGTYDTIPVSGVQSLLGTGDLDSVCINLTHTWDSDISITLISPMGTMFDLSSNNGGSSDNYTNTCFKMSAVTPVTVGTAPFTGAYIPEGAGGFDSFNGENGNGNWMLWIVDGAGGDSGNLLNWNITFAPFNPPIAWSSIPAGLNDTNYTVGVAPTVTTTYIVSITDSSNGCTRNYLDTVVVNPLPVVSLGPDTNICSNYAGITLDGTNPGAGTYLWQDGQIGNTYFAMIAGTYAVEVTDTNGCIGSDTVDVGMITAQVVSIDANLTGIHDADLDAGAGFSSYDWSTTETTQVINVNTNGTYYVTCVDQNGCVSTDSLSIVFSLGLNNNGTESTVQLFPNPSDGGVFTLAINNLETSDLVIEVLDMQGKVVHNRVIGAVSGSTIQPFSLTDLRAGAYNLRMIANGKTSTIRFIIK